MSPFFRSRPCLLLRAATLALTALAADARAQGLRPGEIGELWADHADVMMGLGGSLLLVCVLLFAQFVHGDYSATRLVSEQRDRLLRALGGQLPAIESAIAQFDFESALRRLEAARDTAD